MTLNLLLFCVYLGAAWADYACLCSYDIEHAVYSTNSDQSQILGYMYEFDCKQLLETANAPKGWYTLAYEHNVGYIKDEGDIKVQTCAGEPSPDDLVTTTTAPATTHGHGPGTVSTTPTLTTTVTSTTPPATITTTPRPTTTTTTQPTTTSTPRPTTTATTPTPTTSTTTARPTTTTTTPKPTTTTTTPTPSTTTTPKPTTTTTTPSPTTTTTTLKPTTTTTTPTPTTSTTTARPTTTTTTPKPTTTTTTPAPSTTTTTKATTTTTTPSPTTTTTTLKPTTTTTTPKPTTTMQQRTTTSTPILTTPTTHATQGIPNQCPDHIRHDVHTNIHVLLIQHESSCYEFVPTPVSWSHAEQNCRTNGGHLVTINSESEQTFIYNFLVTNFNHSTWIGLHDRQFEEYFEWVSGEGFTYANWLPNRKSQDHDREDCVYFMPNIQGKWDDIPCGGENPNSELFGPTLQYICEYHAITTAMPTVSGLTFTDGPTHLCPAAIQSHARNVGGVLGYYKNYCYELIPNVHYTWQHGEQTCHSQGGNLAYITSADEQGFLQQFMHRHLPNRAVWIGLSDVQIEGVYQWTSGTPVTFTNWISGHIGNYVNPNEEDCVAFIPYMNGQWDDIRCGAHGLFGDFGETHPIICQYGSTLPGSSGSGVPIIG